MPNRPLPSRADEYRARAVETRAQAEAASDEEARKVLTMDAETWDRMADWEEKTKPEPRRRLEAGRDA